MSILNQNNSSGNVSPESFVNQKDSSLSDVDPISHVVNNALEMMTQVIPPDLQSGDNNKDDENIALLIGLPILIVFLLSLIIVIIIFLCRLHRSGSLEMREKSWSSKAEKSEFLPPTKKGTYDFTASSEEIISKRHPEIIHTVDLYRTEKSKSTLILAPQDKLYKALYNFEDNDSSMLPLKVGMQVEVTDKQQDWWKGLASGASGWFPSSYVEPLKPGEINFGLSKTSDDVESKRAVPPVEDRSLSLPASFTAGKPDSATWWAAYRLQNLKSKGVSPDVYQKLYLVKHIYKANAADELSVKPGDILLHLNKDPNGWIKVKNKESEEEGWVPGACLTDGKEPKHGKSVAEEVTGVCTCDYIKRYDGDISFMTGDPVTVIEKLDSGWWRGIVNEKEGWFPGSYIHVGDSPLSENSGYVSSPQIPPPHMFADIRMNLGTVLEDTNESSTDDLDDKTSTSLSLNCPSARITTPTNISRVSSIESNLSCGKPRKPPRNITRPSIPAPPPPISPNVNKAKTDEIKISTYKEDFDKPKSSESQKTSESEVIYNYLKKTFDGVLYPTHVFQTVDETKILGKDGDSPSSVAPSNSDDNIYESFDSCLPLPECDNLSNRIQSQEIEKTNEYFSNSLKKGVPVATVKPVSNYSLSKLCLERKNYSDEIIKTGNSQDFNQELKKTNINIYDTKNTEDFETSITFFPESGSEDRDNVIGEENANVSDVCSDFYFQCDKVGDVILECSDEEENKNSISSTTNLMSNFDGNHIRRHSSSSSRSASPPPPPLPSTSPPLNTSFLPNDNHEYNLDCPVISPSDSNLSEFSKTLRSSYLDLNFDVDFNNFDPNTDFVNQSDVLESKETGKDTEFASDIYEYSPVTDMIKMLSRNSSEYSITNECSEPSLASQQMSEPPITSLRERSKRSASKYNDYNNENPADESEYMSTTFTNGGFSFPNAMHQSPNSEQF